MLIRVGSVFSVLSLLLVAAACNSDDGTQAYKASTTVSSLAVSGSVVAASRSDADSTQPNSVDTSETTPEVGVNDAEGDVPGFDFKFDGIPVIASFDEYSKITNDAAFKLGIAAWIFDPQKAGGRWTFRFNGATGGAVSEDVTQVQSVGLFVYESCDHVFHPRRRFSGEALPADDGRAGMGAVRSVAARAAWHERTRPRQDSEYFITRGHSP